MWHVLHCVYGVASHEADLSETPEAQDLPENDEFSNNGLGVALLRLQAKSASSAFEGG